VQELTPEIARSLGLPSVQGVIVSDVAEGSPADEVGMRHGDVILEVNQQKVTSLRDYHAALGREEDAESVLFLIRRGDSVMYVALRSEEGAP
jgi:serine protease Do